MDLKEIKLWNAIMDIHEANDKISSLEKNLLSTVIRDQLIFHEHQCLLRLGFPHPLPEDCEFEIIEKLMDVESFHRAQWKDGFQLKLLPEERKMHLPHYDDQVPVHKVCECHLLRLRKTYAMSFDIRQLIKHNPASHPFLLFLICAFGSVPHMHSFQSVLRLNDWIPEHENEDIRNQGHELESTLLYICVAIKYANFALVNHFLESLEILGADLADPNFTPILCYAAEFGYLTLVQRLVEQYKCKPPMNDKNYAIHQATMNGHFGVVKYLMDLDSQYTIKPLYVAILMVFVPFSVLLIVDIWG